MRNRKSGRSLALVLLVTLWAGTATALTIETLPVGNPGNAADPATGYGSVPYTYRISTFEVTNTEYVEFLNAVAVTDTYGLYDSRMGTHWRGGITRSGSSGEFTYSVKPKMGNKPVNYIQFWDATRFANWLQHGQPTGAQDDDTTEDGVYTLGGLTFPPNETVSRNAGARWFLTSEDEWYKAAYYDPRDESQGGPSGGDNYWQYATQSDVLPTLAKADENGDISNPGVNVANYHFGAGWNGAVRGNVTTVGSAGSANSSFFGTFDQVGNVWEWHESIVVREWLSLPLRGMRGGSWDDIPTYVGALHEGYGGVGNCGAVTQCTNANTGIRIATLFVPVDINGNGAVDVHDIDLLTLKVNGQTMNTAYDLNANGHIGQEDRHFWVEELANTYFGDANLDGEFNSTDLVDVFLHAEYEDGVPTNSTWATGDWNGDGDFGSDDFVLALQRDGYERGIRAGTSAVAAVPEPAGAFVFGSVMLMLHFTCRAASDRLTRKRR